jgi:hypothetical protein
MTSQRLWRASAASRSPDVIRRARSRQGRSQPGRTPRKRFGWRRRWHLASSPGTFSRNHWFRMRGLGRVQYGGEVMTPNGLSLERAVRHSDDWTTEHPRAGLAGRRSAVDQPRHRMGPIPLLLEDRQRESEGVVKVQESAEFAGRALRDDVRRGRPRGTAWRIVRAIRLLEKKER